MADYGGAQNQSNDVSTLPELPADVWHVIWSYLDFETLFTKAQWVCKSWNAGVWQKQRTIVQPSEVIVVKSFGSLMHVMEAKQISLHNVVINSHHLRYDFEYLMCKICKKLLTVMADTCYF